MGGFGRDLGYVLNGTGAGADRRDTFACSGFRVVPVRRVKRPPPEPVCPRNHRDIGHVEHPDGADDGVELMRRTVVGQQRPALRVVGPTQFGDACVADETVLETVGGGHPLQIGQDLRLLGERLAPPRVERKRVRIEMRRDVTGRTRIGVVSPGATEAIGAVEDREVVSGGRKLNTHRDTTGTGADDRDGHRNEFSAVNPRSGNAPSANVSALPRPVPPPTGSSTRTSRSRS